MLKAIPAKAFRLTNDYRKLLMKPMIKELNMHGSDYEREVACFYLSMPNTEMFFPGIQSLHASMVSRQYQGLKQEEFEVKIEKYYENMIKRYLVGL